MALTAQSVRLDDRYRFDDGRIFLSGVQALARLPFDQHRADRRRDLRTATMISGYQGSPLGGLDRELARNADLCAEHDVFHVPAVNEELGATAAWGSQLAGSAARRALRRRDRHLVRQGPGPRSRRRRAAPRQRRRCRPGGRRARARRRRPGREVVDPAERVRVAARRPPHPRALPGRRSGGARPRAARPGPVARVRPVGRAEDRHLGGGCDGHRDRRPRTRRAAHADGRVAGQALRAPPRRAPAAALLPRARGDAARSAPRAGARLRARQRPLADQRRA